MNASKKVSILFLTMLFSSAVFAQTKHYTLTIKLTAPQPNAMAFFNHIDVKSGKATTDSVVFTNGVAKFSGSTLHPQKAVLFTAPKNSAFQIENRKDRLAVYLETGNIVVTGTTNMASAKVGGTRLNDDAQAFANLHEDYKEKEAVLFKRYHAIDQKDTLAVSKLNEDADQFVLDKKKAEEAFFISHLNSPIALEWLKNTVNLSQEKTKASELFARMGKEVKDSFSGKKYAEELASSKSAELGSLAPDFTAKTPDGKAIALSSFRGKYVLLDFWASWCGPCRAENPNVLKAYQKYKGHNFDILAYSLDDSREKWQNAIKTDHLPWTQLSDLASWKSDASKLFGVTAIPSNFLIDPNGKIIARDLRGSALEQALEKIIRM